MTHPKSILNCFFDLDGTLTDPREGIVNSIRYALTGLGYKSPDDTTLALCIGPPLRDCFVTLLQNDDAKLIEEAIRLYRERFTKTGMFENTLYPGIVNLLENLFKNNLTLYVVTSKPAVFARIIVKHFQIDAYFKAIYGAELDGRLGDKSDLIAHVLHTEKLHPKNAIMIGDRKHDIIGANNNNVVSIGVSWGYGSLEELEQAAPERICHTLSELQSALI